MLTRDELQELLHILRRERTSLERSLDQLAGLTMKPTCIEWTGQIQQYDRLALRIEEELDADN